MAKRETLAKLRAQVRTLNASLATNRQANERLHEMAMQTTRDRDNVVLCLSSYIGALTRADSAHRSTRQELVACRNDASVGPVLKNALQNLDLQFTDAMGTVNDTITKLAGLRNALRINNSVQIMDRANAAAQS